jgi:hypothetical protein
VIAESVLAKVSAQISKHGLPAAAGLRMTRRELEIALEYYIWREDGVEIIRTIIRRGKELAEGSEENQLLGWLLIGQFKPWSRSYGNKGGSWLCDACFRHKKHRSRYCREHSKDKSTGGWQKVRDQLQKRMALQRGILKKLEKFDAEEQARTLGKNTTRKKLAICRLEERIAYIDRNWDQLMDEWEMNLKDRQKRLELFATTLGGVEAAIDHELKSRNDVHGICHEREWMLDIGLYQPGPPVDWKERVAVWCDTYPWLSTSAWDQESWTNFFSVLRICLRDFDCLNEDFEVWAVKIQAKHAENETARALASPDGRKQMLKPLRNNIAALARCGFTKSQVAASIGVTKSAVSHCIKQNPELARLFADNQRAETTGVSLA